MGCSERESPQRNGLENDGIESSQSVAQSGLELNLGTRAIVDRNARARKQHKYVKEVKRHKEVQDVGNNTS